MSNPVLSWFDFVLGPSIQDVLVGVSGLLSDPDWSDQFTFAVTMAIDGMVGEVCLESKLVILQTVLELLSWQVLVNVDTVLTAQQHRSNSAAANIEQLLSNCGIPLDVPAHCAALVAYAASENITSGPVVFTRLRNKVVHPTKTKLDGLRGAPTAAKGETWALVAWYINLVLLWALNYQGSYSNCTRQGRSTGQTEVVPWAASAK